MRLRNTSNLLKAVREALKSCTEESIDEIIGAVLVLTANPQVAFKSRHSYPPLRFKSPLAQAQCVDLFSIERYPQAHAAGLKHLVHLRGGLGKMASPDLASIVQMWVSSIPTTDYLIDNCRRGDLINASRHSTTPMFPFHSFFGDPDNRHYSATHAQMMLIRLKTGFSNVMPLLPHTQALKRAVNAAAEATAALDHYHRMGSSQTVFADLIDLRNQAQHHALSIPKIHNDLPTSTDKPRTSRLTEALVQENLRLALLVYNNLVLYPLHPACGLADRLALQLKVTLESTQRLCPGLWTLHPSLLLWMLLLGGISIESTQLSDEKTWFHTQLDRLVLKMFDPKPSFQDIETSLGDFLWLGWILNDEGKKFCLEVVSE